jgi:hypothetical protein
VVGLLTSLYFKFFIFLFVFFFFFFFKQVGNNT